MEKYYSLETAGKEADLYIFGEIRAGRGMKKTKMLMELSKNFKS